MRYRIGVIVALSGHAATALAQAVGCDRGPGGPVGVKSYTCASCGVDRKDGKAEYFFTTEPVIIEGMPGSNLRAGDVITSINGKPITTREGAMDFAYPRPGKVNVTYRRELPDQFGRTSIITMTETLTVAPDCRLTSSEINSVEVVKGPPLSASFRLRNAIISRDSMAGLPIPDPTSRLGFAVSCTPSCTKATSRSGETYWKHDGYPAIVALRTKSPAADAGLRLGDLIAEVDGMSVTDEAGSLALQRGVASSNPNGPIIVVDGVRLETGVVTLVIIRDGARIRAELKVGR